MIVIGSNIEKAARALAIAFVNHGMIHWSEIDRFIDSVHIAVMPDMEQPDLKELADLANSIKAIDASYIDDIDECMDYKPMAPRVPGKITKAFKERVYRHPIRFKAGIKNPPFRCSYQKTSEGVFG